MADWTDEASELSELELKISLDKHKKTEDLPYRPDEGLIECIECGNDIDPRRRKATGSLLCFECANYKERKG